MGRIKKAAGPKHEATLSPALAAFITTAIELPIPQLPAHLVSFPIRWPFPRGDLYHWIPLLNRFDNILEHFIQEYCLNSGPQTQPFNRALLSKGVPEEGKEFSAGSTDQTLDLSGFGTEGDRELVESILNFSRMLLENCGNRSLYNSSDRLGEILNTTSLSLLSCTLRLAVRLAQRYHASRQRGANASQHLNNALLASHYNIDLEKVQKLAVPFIKYLPPSTPSQASIPATAPTPKGKDRVSSTVASRQSLANVVHANDLLAMSRDENLAANGLTHKIRGQKAKEQADSKWEDWGGVSLTYYQTPPSTTGEQKASAEGAWVGLVPSAPTTPTANRRASGVSRPSRLSSSDESPSTSTAPPVTTVEESASGGMKTIEVHHSRISSTALDQILKSTLPGLPKDSQYELLCKLRIARALIGSLSTRREILAIRILAITNLAYIYPEATFQQKILQQDSDESRRLQLAYQLADLVHPPDHGGAGIPIGLQTIALGALEALAKHKSKAPDVCAALNVNVNHGVLFYILRKAVADMGVEDIEGEGLEGDQWRDALFSLLESLPAFTPRTGETLVAAGLLDIMIEILTLRTQKAERNHPKVLTFLNTIIYTVRDAFQSFANSKGLDTISDLTAYEVQSSLEKSKSGHGLPRDHRNQVIDYQVPYFQQQTLRWLFKFVNHMMQHGSGNFDRLLRNLIDSPQLLGGLRTVIVNAPAFGSNVWSGAVNILSSFIHNEPTSYAVIAEAGLSRGLLEAVTSRTITANDESNNEAQGGAQSMSSPLLTNIDDAPMTIHGGDEVAQPQESLVTALPQTVTIVRQEKKPLAQGILPATDAIVTVPQAFGAICLNTSGMELFQASGALDSFFEIFESPDHVKSMTSEVDLPRILGNSFDELVRHHPPLKKAVMQSVMIMTARVGFLCKSRAWEGGVGAKLWIEGANGQMIVAGGAKSLLQDLGPLYAEHVWKAKRNRSEDSVTGDAPSFSDADVHEALADFERKLKAEDIVDKEDDQDAPNVSTYINVAVKFLAGFFENTSLCSTFVELGGLDCVLDFATMPTLPYDFNSQDASQEVARVIHMLAEQKPHLVFPTLVRRTQAAVDILEPLMNHGNGSGFFAALTSSERVVLDDPSQSRVPANGTLLVKALVSVQTLSNILSETFSPPIYNPRSSHTVFSQVNLTDMYIKLANSLGRLHRACVWEEILLQKRLPDSWKEATRIKGYPLGSDEANAVFEFIGRDEVAAEPMDPTTSTNASIVSLTNTPGQSTPTTVTNNKKPAKLPLLKDDSTAQFRNVRTLRFLLSQLPSSITPFFQGLGKALITKRRPESYPRQNAYMVADALAEATLEQLRFGAPESGSSKDMYAYWIVILTSVSQLMIEGPLERPHSQCLTLALQSFKDHGGLASIEDLLEKFFNEVTSLSSSAENVMDDSDGAARLASAYGGIKIILTFYTQITNSKYIVDATQTSALESNSREREQPHYFSAAQFLVELRMAVLPVVRKIWNSDFVDKASGSIVKCLIEILKTVLDGEHEHGAFRRSEKIPARGTPPFKIFQIHRDKVSALIEKGYEKELVCEALYRCHNSQNAAEEYCKALQSRSMLHRNPIPSYDKEKEKSPSPHHTPLRQDSEATIPDAENNGSADQGPVVPAPSFGGQPATHADSQVEVEVEEADTEDADSRSMPPPPPASGVPLGPSGGDGDGLMRMSIDNLLNQADMLSTDEAAAIAAATTPTNTTPSPTSVDPGEAEKFPKVVTLDDLNEERLALRNNLIDRALDVLNVHGDVTFELADLITAAAAKATDVATMRREIGETLVQSLISFQMDEDFRSAGKKIAAYANLLALVLQEREFYDATLDELKSNFADLLGFIKVFSDQTPEDSSPWIGQILLIVEKLLAEDAQPQRIEWTPPSSDEPRVDTSIAEMEAPLIPMDEKIQLFEAINEILPRIGKDESLALSVVRVLVILTRNRVIASKLGDRRNMQRLFVMVKQLAGITNEKLQSSFMLVLRHVIEDDETIRQIMRSEIVANFETRPTRPTDTTGYVRQFYHLLLRSPEIFIEVTNEKLKLQKFDASQPPQTLVLKSQEKGVATSAVPTVSSIVEAPIIEDVKEAQVSGDIKPTTEEGDKALIEKPKLAEAKPPVVENPDGVIHYLLCELLSYKDVEDKDPSPPVKELTKEPTPSASSDVEMANDNTPTPGGSPSPVENAESKKADKPEFKADQHPIYIYRCFLLQCLTELLSFYNRSKIEFINFSRKADPKAMTPSKPRSGVLNYLLNAVIPVGTLNHDETLSFRKKSSTSNWAMSAIVALCLKTGEKGYVKKRELVEDDDEPDLLFVRKFVLEHALKAYKDASASNEPLDVKYSRMLCIADLFHRLLCGRLVQSVNPPGTDTSSASQKQLARLMFEKNFISALTSSIADIDLNFPGSKRAVKYILRPLKQLTNTAIVLSESSSISTTPGQTDDDEISTATSVSDMDDEREETPDLFRNSTLGMFEPNREEESSSESSEADEDMYDDEYGEELEYEEEMERDGDEVISDEEEELGGVGHVEGLPGDVGMDLEVVLDGDEDDEDDEDHIEDDDDELDEMDDGEEVEIIDEINGDNENDSLAEGEDEEWQDEDEEAEGYEGEEGIEDGLGESQDPESVARDVRDIMREFQAAAGVEAHLEGGNIAMDIGEEYMDDIVHGEDDEEDEDDEDDMEEEDVIYQPEYEDDDTGIPQPPWGWDPDDDPGMPMPRGHRHRLHGMPSPWTIFPGGPPDRGMLVPTYRSHRPSGAPRGNDDGTNPLLQRGDRAGGALGFPRTGRPGTDAAASMSDWVHAMDPSHLGRPHFSAESPVSFVNNIISAIGQGGPGFATMAGPNGGLHFHIAGTGPRGLLPRELQAMLGLRRAPQEGSRPRDDPTQSATFLPTSTVTRWQEEARLLFGNSYVEKTQRIINSLLRVLVPPAMEAEKIRKEQDLEAAKKAREERERKSEEERLTREKTEKAAQAKREQEEREAAAAAEAATSNPAEEVNAVVQEEIRDEGAMEGVESTTENATTTEVPASLPTEPGPSESAERVRTTIRGRQLDITGMGIDLEYLEALPEELREEVLMHQLAEQRSQAAAAGEEPTDISREFLEALPPEIREELLQQEAQDRRRRERDENRRRAAATGGPPAARAEEMDPASFFASLEPGLRQSVLMETDEEVLAHLPQAMVAEARALGSDRNIHRFGDHSRLNRTRGIERDDRTSEQASRKPQRRQIVQMLDKAGVATLLRLMFVPQQGSSRQSLNGILLDVSQNRQNRAEVVSLLLSILQDGSADVNAVERSFAHLSLRAKQPATQKTPQPLKRALTGPISQLTNTEMTPLMVIQQCLSALVSLTQYNPHIPSFFLTEHETTAGLKNKSSRKGKGKETKAAKFALNALLSLLDRKLIMESSSCMEQLSSLLQSVTHPLTMLLRKDKEKVEVPTTSTDAPSDQARDGAAAIVAEITQATAEMTQTEDTTMAEVNAAVLDVSVEAPLTATTTSVIDGPTNSHVEIDELKKAADEENPKKPRTLIPPVVPEYNLRLVVNILAARECSAKTFRDTLSTINNLSAIPQAKEIFGKELIKQAQELGESILGDLDELVPQIQRAESGTDIQGMALAKFSPASSDQAKLLRVLTALDYLFDPKRNGGKTKPTLEEPSMEDQGSSLKEDLLTTLYENPTFGLLWTKLSDCLSAIRQRENMLNVATILLPLIEALMVVCKNTTLKDASVVKAAKHFAVTSPPPESQMENLFFRFTEDHRKILNDLVRHNPKLMSGTFSLLVKNPKVLEFDNKRNYFTRRLHSRGTADRHPQQPLQLSVRRDQVFLDSFKSLYFKSPDEMKYGKLSIRFHGEEGVDAGGVTREWFQVLSRQMFNPDYALFVPVAADRTTFHPNKLSTINPEHLYFYKFIGRVIGKALYEGRALDCHFSRAVYKRILGKPVSIKDMETLDLDYYKSLLWMLENDITDIITENFCDETEAFGDTQIVDLIENGRNIPVTEENKQEYVQLLVEYRLTGSVQAQLEEFLKGFHDIVPAELISIFNEQELELLISGLPDIDVDDWKNNTEYHNYTAASPQIQWFWRAVRSYDKEERAKLLQFVTGTSKVPLNGFKELEGMNGFSRFNIHRDYGNKDRLPSSHTCFNQLDLPEYESYEALRQQVYTAMTAGSEYFGFA